MVLFLCDFDWQVFAIAPFRPGSLVIPYAIIACQPQRERRMSGADATLAVGDNFFLRRKPGPCEHFPDDRGRLEALSRLIDGFAPIKMDC